MRTHIRTLKELNEANSDFWAKRDEMRRDPAVCETALEVWLAQQRRAVPPENQFSLEEAFDVGTRAMQRFSSQRASKAGAAPRKDTLQLLIEGVVARHRDISRDELLPALRLEEDMEIIQEITEAEIFFTDRHGRTKKANVSGLKDRLTRAKKTLKLRSH